MRAFRNSISAPTDPPDRQPGAPTPCAGAHRSELRDPGGGVRSRRRLAGARAAMQQAIALEPGNTQYQQLFETVRNRAK